MIDDDRKEVTVDGESVKLTPIEYQYSPFSCAKSGQSFFY